MRLTKAQVAPGIIQALLRWKTEASLVIYGRMEPSQYQYYLELAKTEGRSLSSVEAAGLVSQTPEHDPDDFAIELHALTLESPPTEDDV